MIYGPFEILCRIWRFLKGKDRHFERKLLILDSNGFLGGRISLSDNVDDSSQRGRELVCTQDREKSHVLRKSIACLVVFLAPCKYNFNLDGNFHQARYTTEGDRD